MSDAARILLLEDDEHMRETLVDVLSDEGYFVRATRSGIEAVAAAADAAFDLIITDIRMAGMDGLEALARVKQTLPDVGSLVITAYADELDSIRALRLGAGDYLKKPFELSVFMMSVERILATREQEQSRRRREQSLLHTVVRVLEVLAAHAAPRVRQAGWLAREVGRELGLDEDVREETHIATLLVGLSSVTGVGSLLQTVTLPPAIRRIVRASDNGATLELTLESRIVAACLKASESSEWRAQLEAERAGLLDARLIEAIARVQDVEADEESVAPADPGARSRQMLSLGCALEAAGDRDGALRAFDSVAASVDAPRAAVAACLGQARVAGAVGRLDDVARYLDRAVARAAELGPLARAQTMLDAALMWKRLEHAEAARPLLERALPLLDELRVLPGLYLARLALLREDEAASDEVVQDLQALARPEFTADRLEAVGWLFPLLARLHGRHPHTSIERTLQRLVRDVPREVARIFERGVLDASARVATVAAFVAEDKAPLAWIPLLEHDDDAEVRRLARSLLPAGAPAERPPLLRIQSLGVFDVWIGETRVPDGSWGSTKTRFLLAFLAANNGADVSEDLIVERFWPEDVERGRRSLYNAKAALRRVLRPHAELGEIDYVVRQRGHLRLNTELPYWHDVSEVEKLAADAQRASDSTSALDAYRRISQLYRGPYLDGCYMDWALDYRTRLERLVSTALTRLIEHTLARRQVQEAIEYAHRLLDIDPCRQEAHHAIMQAHLLNGHPEQAVKQFEVCRRRLKTDMEMEPSIALLETLQRAKLGLGAGV